MLQRTGTSPENRSEEENEQGGGQEAGRGDMTSQTHREARVSPVWCGRTRAAPLGTLRASVFSKPWWFEKINEVFGDFKLKKEIDRKEMASC